MRAGRATPMGTERAAESWQVARWRSLDGLRANPIGLGSHAGRADDAGDDRLRAALTAYVSAGGNLIDTAVNFRCQRAERVIGSTLSELIAAQRARRDGLIVCTKGGFIPCDGRAPGSAGALEALVASAVIEPGLAAAAEVVHGHCISSPYIAATVERSRHNLGLETIDVYYVHNPELQLLARSIDALFESLRETFRVLEEAVSRGHIARYGVTSWAGVIASEDQPLHLSLERLVALAREVGGANHHLRVLQLPMSVAMGEAFTKRCQRVGSEVVTALEAAAELGIYCVGSGTLLQGRLAERLPDGFRARLTGFDSDAQAALHYSRSTPGICSALAGMATVAHVSDNMSVASVPPMEARAFERIHT